MSYIYFVKGGMKEICFEFKTRQTSEQVLDYAANRKFWPRGTTIRITGFFHKREY